MPLTPFLKFMQSLHIKVHAVPPFWSIYRLTNQNKGICWMQPQFLTKEIMIEWPYKESLLKTMTRWRIEKKKKWNGVYCHSTKSIHAHKKLTEKIKGQRCFFYLKFTVRPASWSNTHLTANLRQPLATIWA